MSSGSSSGGGSNNGLSCLDGGDGSGTRARGKALETPYNTNADVPTFYGLLFTVDVYSNLTITSLDLDVRFPTSGTDGGSTANPVNSNRPKVDVHYRLGPYTSEPSQAAWYSNSTGWTQAFRGKAETDANRTAGGGVVLPPANFTSISVQANDVISFYVSMKGPYLDSTANALVKVGEALVVGDDLRVNVGSGLTDANFPTYINTTIDPGFAGVIHYELQSSLEQPSSTITPPCNTSDIPSQEHHVPNMTNTQLVFPMVWSSNETNLGIDNVNRIMEGTMQRFLRDQHHVSRVRRRMQGPSTAAPSAVQQVGNATTDRESGWMYTNLCPEGFLACPPPAASTTSFDFEHDVNSYPTANLMYDLYQAHHVMVQALNAALSDTTDSGDDNTSVDRAQVAYAGPVPAQLRFDMTLTLESSGNSNGDASDDSVVAGNDRSLDSWQLHWLGTWMEQYLDQAIKSLTANHFIVHNLTSRNNASSPTRLRHVRWLQTNSTLDHDIVVAGTLLGLYESDRVGSAQQYANVVAGAFEKTAESEFLSFLDNQAAFVAHADSNSSVSVFQHLQSVTFAPTVVINDNSTSGDSPTTDPALSESSLTSNSLLLIIIGVVAGCLAVAAAVLTYCCFCKGSAKPKPKRHEEPSEERAPDQPTTSRRTNPLERPSSKLSDSPTNRGAVRSSESDRIRFDADRTATPRRQAPQRSKSIPLSPTSPRSQSNNPRLTRSMSSDRIIPSQSPRPTSSLAAPRNEPTSRGIRRTASGPIASSGGAPRPPPVGRSLLGDEGTGQRTRAQSFDGSPRGGESSNGAARKGRDIRRTRSFDDMPTIRESAEALPRRKTRPTQAYFSSGAVPGVPTQPPRRPLKKSKSMDCV